MNQKAFEDIYGSCKLPCYKGTPYSSKDDFYFLRKYSSYSTICDDSKKPKFYFESRDSSNLSLLNKSFGIDEIIGQGSELQRISKLKKWATDFFHFDGKPLPGRIYDGVPCRNLVAQAKKDGYALNCRYLGAILRFHRDEFAKNT